MMILTSPSTMSTPSPSVIAIKTSHKVAGDGGAENDRNRKVSSCALLGHRRKKMCHRSYVGSRTL